MTQQDIDNIIDCLQQDSPNMSRRQRDKFSALVKNAHNLNYKQLKRLFLLAILTRNFPICPACNLPITEQKDLSIDHVIPSSKAGGDDLANLQPMHKHCNELKGCEIQVKYSASYEITLSDKYSLATGRKHKKTKKKNTVKRMKAWHIMICEIKSR